MNTQNRRHGFTFIELLFVIVILGIVGGIALEAIRQYYENIYRTQETTRRAAEADHILEQLSKYFEIAISASIVNMDKDDDNATGVCVGPPVGDPSDFTVAFVAVDSDSLLGLGDGRPGWNEDVLLQNTTLTALDANYTAANTIINALSGSDLTHSAIYNTDSGYVGACTRFWTGAGGEGYHTITASPTDNTLTLSAAHIANDGKRKYLLQTGYAFRVHTDGNFMMYSNFRPWLGEHYGNNGATNLLARNVAHFYADYDVQDSQNNLNLNDRGMMWRLKVCMRGLDSTLKDTDDNASQICRERRVHVRY